MVNEDMIQSNNLPSAVLASVFLAFSAGPLRAHATLEASEAAVGSYYKAVIKVPHGCQGSPTTALRVTVPEGLVGVKPMPKPGWDIATRKASYPHPVLGYKGKLLTEGVVEIVWSGGRLLDEHYDEFVFQALVSPSTSTGTLLPVPIKQTCETGEVAWSEVAAPGKADAKLAFPAPLLKVTAGQGTGPVDATAPLAPKSVRTQNGLVIAEAWTRATPRGAENAGAFLTVTNTGTAADSLVAADLAGGKRTELHETTAVDGVMRMRQVTEIVIGPGQTITLKPGGLHIMIMGLEKPIEPAAIVKGTLVFKEAGRITVEFPATNVGAAVPPTGHSHH